VADLGWRTTEKHSDGHEVADPDEDIGRRISGGAKKLFMVGLPPVERQSCLLYRFFQLDFNQYERYPVKMKTNKTDVENLWITLAHYNRLKVASQQCLTCNHGLRVVSVRSS